MPSAVPTFGLWYTDALERHGRDLGTGEPVQSGSARIQYLADHVIPQVERPAQEPARPGVTGP